MKHFKLFFTLLTLVIFGCGQMWGGDVTWEQVAWADITTSDVIIVTVTTSNGTYLLEHSQGTSATPKLGNTGSLGSSNTTCTFSENDNVKWKKDASNRLCKASDGTKWLYTGTSNNTMRVGTSTSGNIWSLDGDYIKSNTSSARYLSVYSTTDFRSYTSKQSDQVTRFYKASSCSNQITITNNATTNVDHGSFTVNKTGAQSSCSALSVVVTPTAATHYHVATVSATNPATTGTAGAAVDNKDGTYTITYSANAKGNSTISVTFAEDPKASISFENMGTPAPSTSGYYVGDSYMLPSSNNYNCNGKTFVGWSTVEVASTNTKPSSNFYEPGAEVPLAASQTFYAVFAEQGEGGDETWSSSTLASLTSSDIFVFAVNVSGTYYAMPNDEGTSSCPDLTSITVSNNKITSEVPAKLKWNISGNATDGYVFYPNGSNTTWMYCSTTASSGSNDNIKVGTGSRKAWKVNNSGYLYNDDNTTRYFSRNGTSDFRSYVNTSNNPVVPVIFKRSLSYNYSAYSTDCTAPGCENPTIGTQPAASASYAKNAVSVTALSVAAIGSGTLTYQWYSNDENSNEGGSEIDGATSASYTPSVAAVGTKYYYCVVGVQGESCSTTSSVATINVTQAITGISLNKASTTIEVGSTETLTATISPNDATEDAVWVSSDATVATVEDGVVTAVKAGTATITCKSPTDNTIKGECEVTVTPAPEYKKVTAAPADWSGEYLLVYETGSNNEAYVWTGVEAVNSYATATISNNKITKPANGVKLTIAAITGGYSIMVNGGTNNGKYIYGTSGSNGVSFSDEAQLNTISVSSGDATITSNTSFMQYNSTADQKRFRYYKSGTTTQKDVQLYRKVVTSAVTITAPATGTGSLTLADGQTAVASGTNVAAGTELTVTANPNSGNHYIGGTVTVTKTVGGDDVTEAVYSNGKITMPEYAITVSATFTPTYAVTGASLTGGSFSWTDEDENVASAYVAAGVLVQASASANPGYVFSGTFDIYQTGTPATKVSHVDGLFEMPAYAVTIGGTFNQAPTITLSQTSTMAFAKVATEASTSQTFTVSAANLNVASLSVAISGANTDKFNLSVSSITVTAGAVSNAEVTVTPVTTVAGDYSATIIVDDGNGGAAAQSFDVTLHVENQYTAKWWVNGVEQTTYRVTEFAGADLTFPDAPTPAGDCAGTEFMGWLTDPLDEASADEPDGLIKTYTGHTMPAAAVNYYAVFAEEVSDGTPAGYSLSASAPADGDQVIIARLVSGTYYGLTTAGTPSTSALTVSDGLVSEPGDEVIWNVAEATSGVYLKKGTDYLHMNSSALKVANDVTNGDVVFSANGNGSFKGTRADGQRWIVTSSTNGLGCSDTEANAAELYVFKYSAATDPTYGNYVTTCPHYYTVSLTNEGVVAGKGSFETNKASALAGESVTLTAMETANAGRFKTWSITGLDSYSATTNPLTFNMPESNITVSATFDALYAITKDEQNGTITLGANYAAAGDEVTISASANPQYKNPVITVFKTGDESATVSVIAGAFTMPTYPVTARVVCEPAIEPLDAPVLGTEVPTYQGVTLNWTGVSGNEGYVLTVYKNEVAVEGFVDVAIAQNATSYEIASGLAANTAYTYSIYTKGDGETTLVVNTPENGSFSTDDYPFVHVTYSENGVTNNANTSAEPVGGRQLENAFALPSSVSNECTKVFVGWTDASPYTHGTSDFYAPSANYTIHTNEDVTLYAVYATETPGDEIWTETAISDLTASDVVVIVGDNSDENGPFAMRNDNGTSSAPAVSAVTVSGSNLTGTIAANIRWNISEDEGYYTIYPNGSTETWLYCTNTNNGVRVGTGDAKQFTINQGYLYETATNDNRFIGIYNSQDWRCYTSITGTSNIAGQTFKYYKRGTGAPSYSAHAITCTGKVATPSFSGVTDSETYEEDKTVSLACATGEATIRYTMSNDGTTPADPTGESTAATSISLDADGVYVIKAKAFKDGMDASDVATITVTINKPCTTIEQYLAAAQASDKKLVFTSESNAVVLGVNANRIYIQDLTGGLLLYKTAHEKTWTKGMKVVGTVIGSYEEVDNTPRMAVSDISGLQASSYGIMPSPVLIDGAINAENFAANRNKLVTVNSLYFQAQSVGGGYSINITRGEDTYQIYNAFNALNDHILPLTETACSVTGILGYYGNKYQLMPIEANCITTGATATMPEFVGETGGADVDHPTQVASGEVIKLTAAEGMTSKYTIGESAPVTITTNTEAVISGVNDDLIAITISAEREYYATNSVTYYYKINNALTKYIITSAASDHGTFRVKNSDASAEITSAVEGAVVTLVAEPTHTEIEQYSLDHWTVYETGNTSNTVPVSNNQFEMPSFAVTVSATFVEDAYATVVFDGGDATGDAPASVKKYVGQEVTMPNKGALVKADHVLAGWTYNETDYEIGDTYEIQEGDAAIEGKEITFTANWTPYPWANGGDWMLVTDAAEVTEGSYVIIAAAASDYAMSTTQNNNNRGQLSISKSDNRLTYGETAPAIFEVRAGNIENTLAFYDVALNGYIYAASSSSNWLRTEETLSNNSSWAVEITNTAVAEMQAQGTNSRDKLQYNSTNNPPIFSCYADFDKASIALYKYYAPVPKVTYDKNTTDEVTNMPNPSVQRAENNKAVIASGPSRTGYTFEGWKNGNTTYTVGEEYTFTEDITLYAQWEALPSFHVTYNTSGSQGTTPTDATNYYEGDEVTLASASGLSNAGYFFDKWVATYVDGNSDIRTLDIEDNKFTMPAFDVTVTATWARKSSDKWIKVTATSQLAADKEYIIVNTDATYAVGAQGSNNRTAAAIEENNGILTISDAVAKFTLGIPEENKYTFYQNGTVDNVDKGYLYAASSGSNYMRTQTTNDANGVWTISIGEGGAATVTATGTNTRNIMRYNPNNGSPVFSCYASTSSVQNPVVLYYKAPKIEINDNESVNVSDAAGSDIVIHDGGTLNVDADKQIGDLTVEAGGKVVLDENKLTVVGTFTIETTMASGASGQLTGATASNFAANGPAYIDITLGDNGNPEKWHAFTVPFPVDAINGIYDLDGNKLVNEVNYAIMDYHGDIRATGNYGWKKFRGIMTPGTFYLMTVDGERTTYRFKKTADGALVAGNSKEIFEYAKSGDGQSTDAGWNGVGNPTLMYGKVNAEVQVLDPVNYVYVKKDANSTNFVVGTPFFYQAAAAGSISMVEASGSVNYAPARTQAKGIEKIKVSFGNEEFTDYLDISASEEALNEYQIGKDLAKMTMTNTPSVAQIFGKAYNTKLCMINTPLVNNNAEVALDLYAPAAGEYTIAVPETADAQVYLTQNGHIIWNLSAGAYVAELQKGTTSEYGLKIVAAPQTTTDVEQSEVSHQPSDIQKIIINDNVFILRGEQMFDVTGKAVR